MLLARHASLELTPAGQAALAAAYGEPHRAYHDAAHIAALLRWFDVIEHEVGWDDPGSVYLAILFHDAVYDPLAKDNEARSADLARAHGAGERTCALILLTARHGALAPGDVDRDAAHFLDADTAILGAAPAVFDAYDAAIAREYAAVPAAQFRAGRGRFLADLRDRPRIFLSELFHGRLDAAARANLTRAAAAYA